MPWLSQDGGWGSCLCIITMLEPPFCAFNQWPQVTRASPLRRWGDSSMLFGGERPPLSIWSLCLASNIWSIVLFPLTFLWQYDYCSCFKEVDVWALVSIGLARLQEMVKWGHAPTPGSIPSPVTAGEWLQQSRLRWLSLPFLWTRISLLHHVFHIIWSDTDVDFKALGFIFKISPKISKEDEA